MADITLPLPGESPNWGSKLNTAILRINQELESLGVRVSVAESGLSSLTLRVTSLEGRVTDLEDNLEDLVRDIAAGIIADDPTIIQAAEQAVQEALENADVVFHSDPGAPNTSDTARVSVAFVDSTGRFTFLAADSTDGGPTAAASDLIMKRVRPEITGRWVDVKGGVSVSFTDSTGRPTFLTANSQDGGPTPESARLIAASLSGLGGGGDPGTGTTGLSSVGFAELTGTSSNRRLWANNLTTGVRSLVSDANPSVFSDIGSAVIFTDTSGTWAFEYVGSRRRKVHPRAALTAVGDSLTAAGIWPAQVGTVTGLPVTVVARAGMTSTEVAVKQGGVDLEVTVAGNEIPASGSAEVTTISPASSYRTPGATSVAFEWEGTLRGVEGTFIRHSESNPVTMEFVRTEAGSVVSCPPRSVFHCTEGDASRDEIQVIWVGRNNISSMSDNARDLSAMVDHLTVFAKRFLVLSVTNGRTEPKGSSNYEAIISMNEQRAERYGGRYLDVRTYLVKHGLSDQGISPTAADTTAISEDRIPPSLMTDAIHLNNAGYRAVGNCVAAKLQQMGWV